MKLLTLLEPFNSSIALKQLRQNQQVWSWTTDIFNIIVHLVLYVFYNRMYRCALSQNFP